MENVLLARVDDRLIHGQVMTAWMKLLPAKEIIVIDNKVAKDGLSKPTILLKITSFLQRNNRSWSRT